MKFQFFQILNIIQGYLITQRENAIRFTEMKKETITLKKKIFDMGDNHKVKMSSPALQNFHSPSNQYVYG